MSLACVLFAGWIVAALFSDRCLYADGSFYFIKTLQAKSFATFQWSRHFAVYVLEFPLVLAIKLGATNLSLLRFAFGLGCFLPWPMILLCCYWLSPSHFWVVVAGCAAGYLNACYMAVGEHILAHAFFWPALFAILFARPLKPLAALILLAAATGLLFSYESQLFLCLPLAGLSAWRMTEEMRAQPGFTRQKKIWPPMVLLVASGLFLAASGIGLYAVLKPENPANFSGFRTNAAELILDKGWTLTWTILWGCLMLAVWLSEQTWEIINRRLVRAALFCALLVWGTWPLLAPEALDPARQYHHRILDLLVPLALLPVALTLRYRPVWIESRSRRLAQMAAVLLAVQTVWQICATWQWHQDVDRLQAVLISHQGVVRLATTKLATSSIESQTKDFDWTWPCLSIALNPDRQIRSLVCVGAYLKPQYQGMLWQPFFPLDKNTLPDLRHYRLDFSAYAAALPMAGAAKVMDHGRAAEHISAP